MDDLPAAGPPRPALHVIFVADGSGSMEGERMGSLNWAGRAAVSALRQEAALHPGTDVLVRLLRFGTGIEWATRIATPVAEFSWTNLVAGGESDLGAALRAAGEALAADPSHANAPPPAIIVISDGMPTDDVGSALSALATTEAGRRAVRIAIGIGPDADLDALRAVTGPDGPAPLRAENAEMLASRLRWAATAAFPPDRPAPPPAPPDGHAAPDPDGLTW